MTEIRKILPQERIRTIQLIRDVFMEFEAPDYSAEGVQTFLSYIENPQIFDALVFYGAFLQQKLVGVLAVKDGNHISLFFVDRDLHRRGIGTALFLHYLQEIDVHTVTVNAAPIAVPFYEKLGFLKKNTEQTENGIRYTPMQYLHRRKTHHV